VLAAAVDAMLVAKSTLRQQLATRKRELRRLHDCTLTTAWRRK